MGETVRQQSALLPQDDARCGERRRGARVNGSVSVLVAHNALNGLKRSDGFLV